MDLSSRLRAIVQGGPPKPVRELTYEPDTGGYEAPADLAGVGAILGGVPMRTPFGECLVIDRRYEADRFHGTMRIEDCELKDCDGLRVLDPSLGRAGVSAPPDPTSRAGLSAPPTPRTAPDPTSRAGLSAPPTPRTIFIDLETTGLSGGAGTVAFLVGCGYFDLGAFQVRQFLLTSYASERALLSAVATFFDGAELIVTYNGKTFDVPMMETRWSFHRIDMPLEGVPHFDALHSARRLWKGRTPADDGGCRLSTLERTLFQVNRVGDVPGLEIPDRFFRFLRSGDPRPLEPVLEHNRIDLVSLAAVTAHAARLAQDGHGACRDCAEALALGRIYERAGASERAEACYLHAASADNPETRGEALYRLAISRRRERRFTEAAAFWRDLLALTEPRSVRRRGSLADLRQCAVEALAIHHEHRDRDFMSARELALFALQEGDARRADGLRHRLARLDRKIAKKRDAQLFSN